MWQQGISLLLLIPCLGKFAVLTRLLLVPEIHSFEVPTCASCLLPPAPLSTLVTVSTEKVLSDAQKSLTCKMQILKKFSLRNREA